MPELIEFKSKKVTKLKKNDYAVYFSANTLAKYVDHVDMHEMNRISKNVYAALTDALSKEDSTYQSDELMIALAMLVVRFGYEMDVQNPENEWRSDGFPEFTALISPVGGLAIKRKKTDANS